MPDPTMDLIQAAREVCERFVIELERACWKAVNAAHAPDDDDSLADPQIPSALIELDCPPQRYFMFAKMRDRAKRERLLEVKHWLEDVARLAEAGTTPITVDVLPYGVETVIILPIGLPLSDSAAILPFDDPPTDEQIRKVP